MKTIKMKSSLLAGSCILAVCLLAAGCAPSGDGSVIGDGSGAGTGNGNTPAPEMTPPAITFELPDKWRPAQQSPDGYLYWSTYIPSEIVYKTPPEFERDEREEQHYWKFTMEAFDTREGYGDYSASSAAEAAQEYYNLFASDCPAETCTIYPVSEEEYSGVKVYAVRMIDRSGHPLAEGEYARFFFEKDNYFIEFGYRGDLDDPVGQQTVEKVLSTIKIAGNGMAAE